MKDDLKNFDLGSVNSIIFNTISRPLKRRKCEGKGKRSEEERKEWEKDKSVASQTKARCPVIPGQTCALFPLPPAWREPLSTEGARGALQGRSIRKRLSSRLRVPFLFLEGLWSTQTFSAPSRLSNAPAQPTPFEFLHHPQCCVPVAASCSPSGPNLISLGWRGFLWVLFLSFHSPLGVQRECLLFCICYFGLLSILFHAFEWLAIFS